MQRLEGQFAGDEITSTGFNTATLADNVAGVVTYSAGRMRTAAISTQPTIARPWTIYGFGVQGKGALVLGGLAASGLLGKLQAALLIGGTFTPTKAMAFTPPPQRALPNTITLWDGSQDPPFPFFDGVNLPTGGYFSGTFALPQPQQMGLGDQLALSLWLTPSLTKAIETVVYNTTWTILYDTGS